MLYYAIIGDMIDSRKLSPESRRATQCKLLEILERVNDELGDEIAARFVITLGDEFQGLLLPKSDPIGAILYIKNSIRPIEMRLALGVGEITTPIYHDAALGSDGPAYHNARDAMDCMKHDSLPTIRVKTGDKKKDELFLVLTQLMEPISHSWTDRQSNAVTAMLDGRLRDGRLTQKQLAEELGITQGTVSTILAKAGYQGYSAGVKYIRDELKCYVNAIKE